MNQSKKCSIYLEINENENQYIKIVRHRYNYFLQYLEKYIEFNAYKIYE